MRERVSSDRASSKLWPDARSWADADTGLPALDQELDPEARQRMNLLREAMFDATVERSRIDRFVLLKPIGAGGMGVVHAAYDPRLDRKIALKLVKFAGAGSGAERRLLREAQAMARLSHPNVVQIHEVGTWEGRVFIAMELVAGQPLADWLAAGARSWRQIVEVFIAAGRGLAAAHAVGIVHRDVKPENILVGDDGRVRVTDFGLARGPAGETDVDAAWRAPEDPLAALAGGDSHGTAAFAGTPRYMSPEQFLGEPATPAGDQFSYCVALYQALHGIAPFAGDDRVALARSVLAGERREPPRVRIPRRIHRALVRGMSRAPEARFPTMDALLRAIEPRSSWHRAAPAALLVVAGFGAVDLVVDADPCADASALLTGTWDGATKLAVEQAYRTTAIADASLLWSTTAGTIDAYTSAVASSYTRSCQAQRRVESTPELHDLRVACLRRRLAVVRTVAEQLARGEPDLLRKGPEAATGLAKGGTCDDERALMLGMDPPSPAQMPELARIRDDLDRASALELLARLGDSRGLSVMALARARELGHEPTIAEALYQRARLDVLDRKFAASEQALRESLDLAVASRHDALVGSIWRSLIQALVLGRGDTREAEHWLRQAEAWSRRDTTAPLQQAELARTRSIVYQARGEYVAAEQASREAIELTRSASGAEDIYVLIHRLNHAHLRDSLGHGEEAIATYRELLAALRAKLGDQHAIVADVHYNLGAALLRQGDERSLAEAESQLRRAQALAEASLGADAIELADTHVALAQVAQLRGDTAAAERHSERALRVHARNPGHPTRAHALGLRGAILYDTERLEEALQAHTEARALAAAAWGEGSDVVGAADSNIGDVLRERGDLSGAIRRYQAADGTLSRALGPEAVELIGPALGMGEALLASGRACEARDAVDRAMALMRRHQFESAEVDAAAVVRADADARCDPKKR